MPESDIHSSPYPGPRAKHESLGLVVCTLQDYQVGNFCFRFGPEFGCGSQWSITAGQSFTINANIEVSKKVRVGISYTSSLSTTWTHKSERCEWCKPTLCLGGSSLEVWDCFNWVTGNEWIESVFNPGPAPQIYPNCFRDNAKCNCRATGDPAVESSQGGAILEDTRSYRTVLLIPDGVRSLPGIAPNDSARALDSCSAALEATLSRSDLYDGESALIIQLANGDRRPVAGPSVVGPSVALLCGECFNGWGSVSALRGEPMRILAVGGLVGELEAVVKLRLRREDREDLIFEHPAEARTGRLTTIWASVPQPEGVFEATNAKISVELRRREDRVVVASDQAAIRPWARP